MKLALCYLTNMILLMGWYLVGGSYNKTSTLRGLAGVSSCNLDAFEAWKNLKYTGDLLKDSSFWIYQVQTDIVLTNGLALELAVAACTNRFTLLHTYKAGRSGPITIQDTYKVMCKADCLESDQLHQDAMEASECSCLELSTQSSDTSYHIEGDWCNENTARLLCSMTGYCGVWNCRIDDFMCPRYEWNKKSIPLKGPGTCDRSAAPSLKVMSVVTVVVTAIATLLLYV